MRAHAPGSLTGLYAPPPPGEPEAPSRGASVAVADGVVVDVSPAETTSVAVDGEPLRVEPVERVLENLGVAASVAVEPSVPLGHGFGASGAATLAAALAADATFDVGREREALVAAAHRAELAAGTGEGDVFVQDRGGFLWSGDDGGIQRRAVETPIEWASAGSIETAALLEDASFRRTASRIGPDHIDALADRPTVRAFLERSRAYIAATDLATAFVEREIDRVEAAGGAASMALFGDTVFATGVDGVLPNRTHVATRGARVLD